MNGSRRYEYVMDEAEIRECGLFLTWEHVKCNKKDVAVTFDEFGSGIDIGTDVRSSDGAAVGRIDSDRVHQLLSAYDERVEGAACVYPDRRKQVEGETERLR